jgi:hypothetical protein
LLFSSAVSELDRIGNKSRNDSNDDVLYVAASRFEKVQIWNLRKCEKRKLPPQADAAPGVEARYLFSWDLKKTAVDMALISLISIQYIIK